MSNILNKNALRPTTRLYKKSIKLAAISTLALSSTQALATDISLSQADNTITPSIVGGIETTPNSRPYQVAILYNGRQGCGGTLISPNWVLTAAHCLDNVSTNILSVKLGAHRMSAGDGVSYSVNQIIQHENWFGANNIQSGNDIALLKLSGSVSANHSPASLPTADVMAQQAAVGRYATVSGWGKTSGNSNNGSDILREVNLPIISNGQCSNELGTNLGNSVICGGGTGGVSACNGDSGGPFVVSANNQFYNVGIVSWGKNCVGATAFTRTYSYLDWIESKTGIGGGGDGDGDDDDDNKGCDGLAAWNATTSYAIGDRVSLNGVIYQATWWSTGASPEIYANVWNTTGQCSGDGGGDDGDNGNDNQAPVADFNYQTTNLTVSFNNLSTDDDNVVSSSWDFGDNNTSSLTNPSHTYAVAGTYQVTLLVVDAQGKQASKTTSISVSSASNDSCSGLANWNAASIYNTGDTVQYQGVSYTANWWTSNNNPAQNSGQWQVWTSNGACI